MDDHSAAQNRIISYIFFLNLEFISASYFEYKCTSHLLNFGSLITVSPPMQEEYLGGSARPNHQREKTFSILQLLKFTLLKKKIILINILHFTRVSENFSRPIQGNIYFIYLGSHAVTKFGFREKIPQILKHFKNFL